MIVHHINQYDRPAHLLTTTLINKFGSVCFFVIRLFLNRPLPLLTSKVEILAVVALTNESPSGASILALRLSLIREVISQCVASFSVAYLSYLT